MLITIRGTGALSTLTIDINDRAWRRYGPIRLPYSYRDTNVDDIDGAYPVTVVARAVSGPADDTVSCRIVELGARVASSTATGPRPTVACSDHQPEDPLRVHDRPRCRPTVRAACGAPSPGRRPLRTESP